MLLVIGFDALPDLFHNFRRIDGALCLEIIALRIVFVSYDDHLEDHSTSEIQVSQCYSEAKTYPESLGMSPTHFTADDHAERHPASL